MLIELDNLEVELLARGHDQRAEELRAQATVYPLRSKDATTPRYLIFEEAAKHAARANDLRIRYLAGAKL